MVSYRKLFVDLVYLCLFSYFNTFLLDFEFKASAIVFALLYSEIICFDFFFLAVFEYFGGLLKCFYFFEFYFVVYDDIFDAKNAVDHLSGFNVCNRYLTCLYF